MIAVTEDAALLLDAALDALLTDEGVAIRIALEGNLAKLRLSCEGPGDVAFELGGRTILLIESQVAEALGNRILDMLDTPSGPALVLFEAPELGDVEPGVHADVPEAF